MSDDIGPIKARTWGGIRRDPCVGHIEWRHKFPMMGFETDHLDDFYLSALPDFAIIPDPNMDRNGWAILNKPFPYILLGMHVWEDFKSEKGPITIREFLKILTKERS
jgi:hypothetical protein